LLLLSLTSFVTNAAVTNKPGAPGLSPGRFVVWAFFAFLSVLQVRLIPWFAIASAPITLLNVVDWRTWLANLRQQRLREATEKTDQPQRAPNWRLALVGRGAAIGVFLVLFFLAWPGWINAQLGSFTS